jgi:hypothetical protein
MADATAKKPSLRLQFLGLLGAAVGAVVGRLAWPHLLAVSVCALVLGVPLYLVTRGKRRRMVPSGALQAGHGLWILIALWMPTRPFLPVQDYLIAPLVEASLFTVAAVGVVLWPSPVLLVLLTAYQSVALVLNALALAEPNAPAEVRTALVAHIFLRVLGVGLMCEAFFRKPSGEGQGEQPNRLGAEGVAVILLCVVAIIGGSLLIYLALRGELDLIGKLFR